MLACLFYVKGTGEVLKSCSLGSVRGSIFSFLDNIAFQINRPQEKKWLIQV